MNIAIIEDNIVVNIILCESIELAESITGLTAIEYTDENLAQVGWTYNNITNKFRSPQPYSSWIFNEEINTWQAPVPYPTDENNYIWSEDNLEWQEVE